MTKKNTNTGGGRAPARPDPFLMKMYDAMYGRLGPRGWWPARTRFEVCVGAILTQNTAWKNVRKAIGNLRSARRLSPAAIYELSHDELAELIVPSGYYNVKAKRLRNFVSMLVEDYGGSLPKLFSLPMEDLREVLLAVNGVGRETADSMILYAAKKPVFVVDAYTRRIGSLHGLFPPDADYETMRMYFTERLPEDAGLFNEYHALIVGVGYHWCRGGRQRNCADCPLRPLLPDND